VETFNPKRVNSPGYPQRDMFNGNFSALPFTNEENKHNQAPESFYREEILLLAFNHAKKSLKAVIPHQQA
jgi:hypothetical protein